MLKSDFSDAIRLWRKEGLSWQQIADNLETQFNIFTSAHVLQEDFDA